MCYGSRVTLPRMVTITTFSTKQEFGSKKIFPELGSQLSEREENLAKKRGRTTTLTVRRDEN